ncbi:MAG: HEAT repeat domain-containing protein [Planctomycetes bacterium]|nr:HEAT repeat domain-containing protein [Planctomycetota bacterium]
MRTLLPCLLVLVVSSPASADVKASEQKLRQALASGQRKALAPAVQELVGWDNAEAMKALLRLVSVNPGGVEPAFWMEAYALMLRGCAGMTSAAALKEAGDFIVERKGAPVARDLLAMLCNQGRPEMVPPLLAVLEKGADDMRILAAEHLLAIGDKRAVEPLIAALKDARSSPELKRRAAKALAAITGQDYGDSATNWEGWWAANKDKDLKGPKESSSGGGGTVALDRGRDSEWEELKREAKVLILGAGDKCKCGHNHDLDNIEATCRKLGLTSEFIDKAAFEKDDFRPDGYIAILANCTMIREHCTCPQCKPSKEYGGDRLFKCECPVNKHDPWSFVMGKKGADKIRRYVEGGGYLFAEDWCMEDFVEKAFPEFVRHGSVRDRDEEVSVVPAAGTMTHPYMKKIFFKGYKPKTGSGTVSEDELKEVVHTWKIDKETRTIKIVDPKRVVTILQSPELEKYASGDDAVAVTFTVGAKDGRPAVATSGEAVQDRDKLTGGRVLYVLSHFGKQKSAEDEYSLQNLLINFLSEAHGRHAKAQKPPKKR